MKIPSSTSFTVGISALAAGGVFALGLPWFVLPTALAVFFWKLTAADKPRSLKYILLLTSLFFCLYYTVVLSWFLDTDVSLLAGINKQLGPLVLGFCLLAMAVVLTLASLPFGAVLYTLQSRLKQPGLLVLLALTSSWALVEWLRSLVFSVFLSAPEASIGDYWSFGSLGLGIIATPVGYMSRIVGMYGLSMLVVALSLTLYWASKKYYKPLAIIVLLALVGSLAGYQLIPSETSSQPIEARLLQGSSEFSGLEDSAPIRNKSGSQKDLIVLPEYSRLHGTENVDFTENYVTSRLSDNGVVLDVSADFGNPGPRKSFLITRDAKGIVDSQSKRLLIPTGEFLPSIVKGFYGLTNQQEIIDQFASTRKLEKGEHPHVVRTKNLVIAPVACSGILGRNIYRKLVNDGGNVLTNSASLATFAGSHSYFQQSIQMARFHAVANNRPFIQATIGAPGFVIDSDGRYILAPDGSATEFADFSFTPKNNKTLYTKYGDWPLILGAMFMTGFSGHLVFQNRKSSK